MAWQLEDGWGKLTLGDFSCAVELRHPDRGLQRVHIGDLDMSFVTPLCVSAQPPAPGEGEKVRDSYVRGDDLIATYGRSGARTVHPQIYWRGLGGTDRAAARAWGVELWLSVETHLLASDPSLVLWSGLGCVEQVRAAAGLLTADAPLTWTDVWAPGDGNVTLGSEWNCFLVRFAQLPVSYCHLIYPSDCDGVLIATGESQDRMEFRHRLFSHGLEKGVIRRGRVRGGFVARQTDEQLAADWFRALCTAPLPLTV